MADQRKQRILQLLMGWLKPVAKFLLRTGVSYRDFSEIAKRAFVDAAVDAYGVRGRPTNVSRVALLTGLTRKEVRQIKASGSPAWDLDTDHRSLPAEVLHRWHTAPQYLDAVSGLPLQLPFSNAEPSFAGLVRECMRDIPPGAVRTELKRLGVIHESNEGLLRALRREVVPVDAEAKLEVGLETGLTPLARTIEFNSDPDNVDVGRFQRVVSIPFIRQGSIDVVEAEIAGRLESISEDLDDFLARYEAAEAVPDKKPGIGVGLYYYREEE